MKFFDASRYASPLRKALAKKENAPRNLRFETLENRALLSVTPLDELQAAVASAEIAPAQTVETPVVDLSALAVSNATTESDANDDQYEDNDASADATPLGVLTATKSVEGIAAPNRENDWYAFTTTYTGTDEHSISLKIDYAYRNHVQVYLKQGSDTKGTGAWDDETGAKVISFNGLPVGDYAIQIYSSHASSYIPYTLTIEPPKPETDDRYENVSDEVDNNDSAANAYDLDMVGDLTLDAKAGPSRDADYFKFTMVGTGTADNQIALSAAANAVLNFRIFKEGATDNVDSAILSTMTSKGSAVLSLEGLAAGDYYVLIDNNVNVDSFVKYSLTFNAPKDAPAEPTNLETNGDEAEYNYTTLSWDAVDYVTGYELRYTTDVEATDAEANWKTAGTVAADVTEFTTDELGLAYGTEYKFQVRALRVAESDHDRSAWDVASDWSDACVFTTVDAPEPPEGLKASVLDPETLTVKLSWDDLDNELGYVVELLDADGETLAQSDLLEADTTTWTTPELALGTTYKFQVTAKNNAGDATSELFEFTTENVPTVQPVLTATVAPSASAPTATLKWDAVDTATAYVVEQLVVDGETATWTAVQTLENGETEWTTAAEANATYAYRVVAANAYGSGVPSEAVEFTPDAASTVVTTLDDVVNPADGLVSLREAIQYAEVGATVTFAEMLKGETLKLGGVCLQIDKAIAIDGSFETGAPQITLDADAKSRVFNVEAGTVDAPVKLVGLTITNGYADVVDDRMQYGGGIRVGANAALDVANSKIVGNRSTERGGGVYLNTGATGNFTNVEITGNVGRFYGGGVAVGSNASATFRNATIIGQSNVSNQTGIDVDANSGAVKFYNSIVQYVGTSQETQTLEAYNTASDFTDWTNADEEGVVNYELDATQPLFTDATKGDYTLADGSQALNKGDNAYVPETLTTDLAGNPRLSGRVDLGAYEFQGVATTAPTGLTATVAPSTSPTATLTWDAVESDTIAETVAGYEVTLYQIVVDADGETTVVALAPQTVTEATYTTETLDFGGTYYFEVAAVNAYGASEVAKSENFTVGTVPTAPTELTADLDEAALTASLSWTAASNHTGYRVELQTQNADGETVWETVDNLDVAALTWSTDVAVDTTYLYRVVAWNAYGKTASETVEVVVENVPTQPTGLDYTVDYSSKAATLTWGDNADDEDGYRVELQTQNADGETVWESVATLPKDATTWTSDALDFGTSYAFRVVAKNAYGSSAASNAVDFAIQDRSTVVTTADDGYNLTDDKITLREAIYYAEAGDTITFAETLKGGTITLTGGSLSIMEKEISVRGFVDENGAPELTIDGDRKAMIFRVANTRASFFGLTVVNGVASYEMYGGGAYGGGFCFDNANAILTNVDIIGCQADVYGGGVYIASNVDAPGEGKSTLTNVRILDNVADNGDASGQGGGLYAVGSFMGGELEMTNVEISGNQTQGNGGGLFLNDITSTLTNVKITDNIAEGNGGAFYATAPDHAWISDLPDYPLIEISTKLTNVEITGNQAYKGFGFYAEEYDVEELSLRNVTFADNAGTEDGAFADVYLNNGAATFYNSIFDGNVQGTTNAYNTLSSFTGWANATEDGVVNYVLNEGDSVFKDAANDDYTLAADSFALNKGDVAYLDASITTDLAGNARIVNATVDVGAYEGPETASTVVTITADVVDAYDGEISLREALAYAKSGETVSFAEDLRGQTIKLAGEELKIAKALTIQGLVDETGAPQITIDADGKSRVFNVAAGNARKPVSISGLTLIDGNATNGGAVYVASGKTVNFTNVKLTGNKATNYGGAVYANSRSVVNFENATLSGNQASYGAAASISGTATFTNNVIAQNTAISCAGGVFVSKLGTAEFEGNEISGNTATSYAGGVYVSGTATFVNDEIAGNTTNRNGGGLYVSGTVILTNATIAGNQAVNGAGAHVVNGGTVDVTKGQFTGNIATNYGGGAYVVNGGIANFESATFSGNKASYGGATRVDGTATFTNNVIAENIATGCAGAVFVGKSGTSEFEGNEISGNTATSAAGGVYTNGTATFVNDKITGNVANRYGGGFYVGGTATLTNAMIAENQAANGGGAYVAKGGTANVTKGQFTGNIATNYGGGAYVVNGGIVNFENATLSGNQASFGAAARVDGTATFKNNVISENTATSYAGGVFVGKSGTAEFEGNEISNNNATYHAGGVYANGTATFVNDKITGNITNRYGGGLYVGGTATLTGAMIAENQAANGAGAYVANGGTANFEDSTLEDAVVGNVVISDSSDATPTSAAFADAFDELDFFVDEDELDALAKRLI